MYWAKELRFGGEDPSTLNYNIRMLDRRGVLVLNAIAGMDQLATIEQATPQLLSMVNFQDGHRYADFNASTDKVATYGLAALVAGGLLAKGGFLKVLIAGLLAAKKFVIIGAIAHFAGIKKLIAKFSPPQAARSGERVALRKGERLKWKMGGEVTRAGLSPLEGIPKGGQTCGSG